MRLLVTGGNGQLGQCISDSAAKYDTENTYHFANRLEVNVADYNLVCTRLDEIKPNIVINCAAYVKTDKADGDTLNAYMANAMGPAYLAIACKERNIELIHISTECVFDGSKTTAYETYDKCNPINAYGASKYCGEEAIKQIYHESIIIRTSWLYSEYGDNFLTKTLKNIDYATKTSKDLRYLIDQVGCPTYARNLADFIVKDLIVAQKDAPVRNQTIYHYTDDGVASRYDFAKAIERLIYKPCMDIPTEEGSVISGTVSELYNDGTKRPQCCILNKTETLEDFEIKIKDWQDSLAECATHFAADAQLIKNILDR